MPQDPSGEARWKFVQTELRFLPEAVGQASL